MLIDLKDIDTFYINLNKDKEKNVRIKKELQNCEIKNFTRVTGVDKPNNKESGCASSHYNILSKASSPITILEDDCVIYKNKSIIEVPDNADAIYLGLSRWGNKNNIPKVDNYSYSLCRGYKDIYKIDGMLATHAILYLSEEYLDVSTRIAKYCAEKSVHIDVGFTTVHKFYNIYALGQPFFYQSTNEKSTKISLRGSRK